MNDIGSSREGCGTGFWRISRGDAEVQTETMTVTRNAWVDRDGVFQYFNPGTETYTDSAWMNDVNGLGVFGSPDGTIWGFNSAAMGLSNTDWGTVSWSDDATLSSSGDVTVEQVVSSFTSDESYSVDWTTTHDTSVENEDGTRVDAFTTTQSLDSSTHYTVECDEEGNYSADELWTHHLTGNQTDTIARYPDERAAQVASVGSQTWSGVDNSSLYLFTSWGDATDTTSPKLDAGEITIDQSRNGTYSGSENWNLVSANGVVKSGAYSLHDHSTGTVVKDWFDFKMTYRQPEQPMETFPAQPAVQGTAYLKSHLDNATYTDDSTLNATYSDGALLTGNLTYHSEGSQGYDNASGGSRKTFLELPVDELWFNGLYADACVMTVRTTASWNDRESGTVGWIESGTADLKTGTATYHLDRDHRGTSGGNALRSYTRLADGLPVLETMSFSIVSDTFEYETHLDAARNTQGTWTASSVDRDDTETSTWAGFEWSRVATPHWPVVTTSILYNGNSDSFYGYHANNVAGKIDSGSVIRNATSTNTERKTVTVSGSRNELSGLEDPSGEDPPSVIGVMTVNDREDRTVTDTVKLNGELTYAAGKASGTVRSETKSNSTLGGKIDHRLVLWNEKGFTHFTSTASGGVFETIDSSTLTLTEDAPSATRQISSKTKLTTADVTKAQRKLSDGDGHTGTLKLDGTSDARVDDQVSVRYRLTNNAWQETGRNFRISHHTKAEVKTETTDDGLGTGPDPAPYLDQNGQQVTSTGTHSHTLGTLARDKFDLEHSGDQDTSTKVTERSNFRKRTEIRNVTRNWSNGDSSRGRVFTEGTSTKSEKTTSIRANGVTMPFHLDRLSKSNSSRNENSGGVSGGVTRSLTSESRSTYQKKRRGRLRVGRAKSAWATATNSIPGTGTNHPTTSPSHTRSTSRTSVGREVVPASARFSGTMS